MKILKAILIIVLLFAVVFFVLSFLGPKDYSVERSKEINASAEQVYGQIVNFNNWSAWSRWAEMDTETEYTLIGEDGKVGTKRSWKSKITGEGSMEILEALPYELVSHKLLFTAPMEAEARTRFEIETVDSTSCILTWKISGKIDFLGRAYMLLKPMDSQIGPDFERGLFKLDSVVTNLPPMEEAVDE